MTLTTTQVQRAALELRDRQESMASQEAMGRQDFLEPKDFQDLQDLRVLQAEREESEIPVVKETQAALACKD